MLSTIEELPTEILVRIFIISDSPRTVTLCRRVCKRFANLLGDASFRAAWLVYRISPLESLRVGVSLTLQHPFGLFYRWLLNEETAFLLIARGADIDPVNDLLLVWAADAGFAELFSLLLDTYSFHLEHVRRTGLSMWVILKMTAHCLKFGMGNNYLEAMHPDPGSREHSHLKVLDLALHAACAAGSRRIVEMILDNPREDHCVNINSNQCFSLRVCLAGARFDILDLLLARGARLHFDLLDICYKKATTEDPSLSSLYRDWFLKFYFAGVPFSTVRRVDELLQKIHQSGSLQWWPILKRIAIDRRADPTIVAKLVLHEIVSGRPDHALAMLGTVPARQRHLRQLELLARWLHDPGAGIIDYGQVIAFAIRLQNIELIRVLLINDEHGYFKLPWVIQCAYAEQPESGLEKMFLARWGLTRNKAYDVTATPKAIQDAVVEYVQRVPYLDASTCLDWLVAVHIRHERVDIVEKMVLAGANIDTELNEILSEPFEDRAVLTDIDTAGSSSSREILPLSLCATLNWFHSHYSDDKIIEALLNLSKSTLYRYTTTPRPLRTNMLLTLLRRTRTQKQRVLRAICSIDPYKLKRLLSELGESFLQNYGAEILATSVTIGSRSAVEAVLGVKKLVEVIGPTGLALNSGSVIRQDLLQLLKSKGLA